MLQPIFMYGYTCGTKDRFEEEESYNVKILS